MPSLIDFSCSKWYDLNGRNFGECFLKDDDDMAAMFVWATHLRVDRIDVSVHSTNESTIGVGALVDYRVLVRCIKY